MKALLHFRQPSSLSKQTTIKQTSCFFLQAYNKVSQQILTIITTRSYTLLFIHWYCKADCIYRLIFHKLGYSIATHWRCGYNPFHRLSVVKAAKFAHAGTHSGSKLTNALNRPTRFFLSPINFSIHSAILQWCLGMILCRVLLLGVEVYKMTRNPAVEEIADRTAYDGMITSTRIWPKFLHVRRNRNKTVTWSRKW